MKIQYVDRITKEVHTEDVYGRRALSLLYGSGLFARLFAFFFLPMLASIPLFSRIYGNWQKRPASRKKIKPFIEAYHIDASEFEDSIDSFGSFNDFFIRKIKKSCRPVDPNSRIAVMPADGRYLVIPDVSRACGFYVKGQHFDLSSFLLKDEWSRRYKNGSMAIARLCPVDYHRFHFPVDGIAKTPRAIQGPLFSVNPIALRKRLSILWENKRVITEIISEEFGTVSMVEIGATCVGSIHQIYSPGPVHKGNEKGYFSFGGSCIVLLFEKNRIMFDEDLVANTSRGIETRGLFGVSLGRRK